MQQQQQREQSQARFVSMHQRLQPPNRQPHKPTALPLS
jgi:hypothetical protein